MLYVNPLGKVVELDPLLNSKILPQGASIGPRPVYNYTNKVDNLRKNNFLNNARLEDIEKKLTSNKIHFIIYSIFACIFIIMFLIFLKKFNR
jgi:hypothetical protein